MGGGSKKTTKETRSQAPPSWVEDSSKSALDRARRIADTKYTPYTGERIAGLSSNEQQGIELAASSAGGWQPYIDKANAALERAAQPFTSADMDAYMNPYIKGALDPAAREMRQQGALRLNELRATEAQRDAFGGARGALLESETNKNIDQGLSDFYGRGYASAFESGADRWAQDRDAAFREAGGYQTQAQLFGENSSNDIRNLMFTGSQDRGIQQAMKDFDYQQFVEGRDWDLRGLQAMLTAIQGTHGSYTVTEKSKKTETESGDAWGQALGLVATVAGAYFTGGASLMAQGGGAAAAGAVAGGGMGSDRRLKKNIQRVGTHLLGIGLYTWDFIWGVHSFGVMADEVETVMPEAVGMRGGFKTVDYAMLGGF